MLSYNGKKIVPAPLISINKVYNKSNAGESLGMSYNIVLTGTLLPFRGSPSGNYTDIADSFWDQSGDPPDEAYEGNNEDFHHILRKQEALRYLFKDDGKSLEWQPSNGQPVVKCNPRIESITFEEGSWSDRGRYIISCTAEWIYLGGSLNQEDNFTYLFIEAASEEWSFEEQAGHEGKSIAVTHSVRANGTLGFDENGNLYGNKDAWENAKSWVDSKITGGIDSEIADAIAGASGWIGGSYIKNTNIVKEDGSYIVIETFLLMESIAFVEKDFSLVSDIGNDTLDVTYTGIIHGVADGERKGGDQAISNAKTAIPTNVEAKDDVESALGSFFGDKVLPATPTSKNISINMVAGTVSYNYQWKTGDDEDHTITREANMDYNGDNSEWSFSLTINIEGKGETAENRLANAKLALPPDDAAAKVILENIIGAEIPSGVSPSDLPSSRGKAFNETRGSIRAVWGWKTTDEEFGSYIINVQEDKPVPIIAEHVIPGRVHGPIIQDLQTDTHWIINVSLSSDNNESKPDDAEVIAAMNDAGSIQSHYILRKDTVDWNLVQKTYRRTRTHIVTTGEWRYIP